MLRQAFILLAAASLLLTACGGGGQQQGESGDSADELTIGIWNDAQRPALERVLEECQSENSGLRATIEVTPFDLYWQKLEAAATGGVAPDVFWMNAPNVARYAEGGVILPLMDYVESGDVDLADYSDAIVEMYTIDGELYALPRDLDVIGLWYNEHMFEEAGVAPPDETWTWDDVRDAAEQLTDSGSGVFGIAAHFNAHQGYWNTIYQQGGRILSEDKTESEWTHPGTQEGIQLWVDLIDQGLSPSLAQMTDTEARTMLESGVVAMWPGGSWHAIQFAQNEQMRDKLNVAPLPAGEQEAVILHGLGYAISAGTPDPDAAWQLVTCLTSASAAEIEGSEGNVIPAREDEQHLWAEAYEQFDLQPLLDQLDHAVPYPVSVESPEWFTVMEERLRPVWAGTAKVEEATRALKEDMDAILADE